MCGICGIVIPDSSSRSIDDSAFTRLRDTLAHRGPSRGSRLAIAD